MLLLQCKVHGMPIPCNLKPLLSTVTSQLPSLAGIEDPVSQFPSKVNTVEGGQFSPLLTLQQALHTSHGVHSAAQQYSSNVNVKQKGTSSHQYLARVSGTNEFASRTMQHRRNNAVLFARALSSLVQIMGFAEVPPQKDLLAFMDTYINRNKSLAPDQLNLFLQQLQEFPSDIQVCQDT